MREFIYQEDEKGCGLACLKMALIDVTKQNGYKFMRLEEHPPYSLRTLKEEAAKEGVEIEFYQARSPDEIFSITDFPAMFLMKGEENEHLVYIPKERRGKLLIYDPAIGKYWIKKEEFKNKWKGVYGFVKRTRKEKCHYSRPRIVSPLSFLLMSLMSLLSYLCLFGGFFFVSNEGSYLYSILLLAGYGVFEILSRFIMIKTMKRFDSKWLAKVGMVPKDVKKRYEHYTNLKRMIFPSFIEVTSSLLTSASIIILFGLNDWHFYLCGAIIILYCGFSSLLIFKRTVQRKANLEKKENNLLNSLSSREAITESLTSINAEAYKIGSIIGYEQIISIIVTIACSLLPFLGRETISLNFFLLNFGALYVLYENVSSIIKKALNEPFREREMLYFYEYFAKENL